MSVSELSTNERISDGAVQVVQDLYAAFGQGDLPAILNLLAADVEWQFNGRAQDIPYAGRRVGHEAMIEFFTLVVQQCEILEFGPQEIISLDEHVLCLGRELVLVRATGRIFETEWAHLFTIQAGRISRLREFYDTARMAEAFRQ